MPRVSTQKARKDYPDQGIKKGDTYYSWSFYRGPTQRSATPPKQSQLCNNVLSGAYAADEDLQDAVSSATCPDDVSNALNDAASAVRDVITELEDQISNMEEAFQGGSPQIDEKTEQKDNLETYADELESAASDVEQFDVSDYIEKGVEGREKAPESFDELNEEEKDSMLEAARERAGEVSLDL